jgi:hypothetical protein
LRIQVELPFTTIMQNEYMQNEASYEAQTRLEASWQQIFAPKRTIAIACRKAERTQTFFTPAAAWPCVVSQSISLCLRNCQLFRQQSQCPQDGAQTNVPCLAFPRAQDSYYIAAFKQDMKVESDEVVPLASINLTERKKATIAATTPMLSHHRIVLLGTS